MGVREDALVYVRRALGIEQVMKQVEREITSVRLNDNELWVLAQERYHRLSPEEQDRLIEGIQV